jgi:ankyrin repeat protein
MLNTFLESNSLEVWSGNFSSDSSPPPTSSSGASSTQYQHASSGMTLIKDLILVTSFMCSNSHEFHIQEKLHARSSSSATGSLSSNKNEFIRKNTASPLSVLIAISPYWAIAALLSQAKSDQSNSHVLRAALKSILTGKYTSRAHIEIGDEILHCTNHLPSSLVKSAMVNQLLARLRRCLRTHLKNVLLFAVVLSVSVHTELSATLHHSMIGLNQGTIDNLLLLSDDNCIEVVRIVINSAPQLALATDTGSVGATPLAYAASYQCTNGLDSAFLEYKLALGLCKILTDVAPSALAICDRLGMLPLHHAARKGHSAVVEYLSRNFYFTVPLRDSSGKTVLHHALINWKHQQESTILQLARMYPKVLKDSTYHASAFDPLEYAQKHCPESLAKGLYQIYAQETSLIVNIPEMKVVSNDIHNHKYSPGSPTGVFSTGTDPEFSESEAYNTEESFHENDSIDTEDDHRLHFPISKKDQELLQFADTLLLLQSAKATCLEDKIEPSNQKAKRQRIN